LKYRKLGKTGLLVSEIGLGTAQIGGASLIAGKYTGSPAIENSEAIRILNTAYDSGINLYDTSDKYGDGRSERLLGEVFSANRGKVILATKCGITSAGKRCFTEGYIRSCLEESLKNLNTDYVDIFQLNKSDMALIRRGQIYAILEKLRQEGKIRFTGVSTGTDQEAAQLVLDNKIDTLQIFYNLFYLTPNELFIGKAYDCGIGLIIRSPLSSGVLVGGYSRNTKFSEEDDRSVFLYGKVLAARVDMVDKITRHFKLNAERRILHLALNYLLSNNKISTVIPGVSKESQFQDILKACVMKRMTLKEFLEVEKFVKENYR